LSLPDSFTFERIDSHKLRVIGVTVLPRPEVSPGDTVRVIAYFGGNPVVSVEDIKISHTLFWGTDGWACPDAYPLTVLKAPSGLPDSAEFSFVVNRDVFIGRGETPRLSQTTIDSVARLFMGAADSVSAAVSSLSDDEKNRLGAVLDAMELPAVLTFNARSENGKTLPVLTRLTYKYHSDLPGIRLPVENAEIRWAGICKVPDADALGFWPFDPASVGKFAFTYLYNKNNPALCDSVIVVDTGYAYFLVADNGRAGSLDSAALRSGDSSQTSTYAFHWFYESPNDAAKESMTTAGGSGSSIEMRPPTDSDRKNFRIWVTVSRNENTWGAYPSGTSVRRLCGEFKFTEAYVDSVR
jgi:hypothetical protein